jgi:hypothetical protein
MLLINFYFFGSFFRLPLPIFFASAFAFQKKDFRSSRAAKDSVGKMGLLKKIRLHFALKAEADLPHRR